MRIELRTTRVGDKLEPRGLVCIAESKEESRLLDKIFGDKVGADGLIGERKCECRLSDGYGDHYVFIKAAP